MAQMSPHVLLRVGRMCDGESPIKVSASVKSVKFCQVQHVKHFRVQVGPVFAEDAKKDVSKKRLTSLLSVGSFPSWKVTGDNGNGR